MIRSLGCQFGSRLPQSLQPPGTELTNNRVSTWKNSTQRLWPVSSGVVKTEKPGNAMPAPTQLYKQVIRGWCRRTSSPGKGSRRRGRARWGGLHVCGRHSMPSGLRLLWTPATWRQRARNPIGYKKQWLFDFGREPTCTSNLLTSALWRVTHWSHAAWNK